MNYDHTHKCPICVKRLMLCSACHDDTGNMCDYDSKTYSCKFNPHCAAVADTERRLEMPKTVQFKIDYPPTKAGKSYWNKRYGLNAYYSGKPWQARKRDADYWHALVRSELTKQKIPMSKYNVPVSIKFWFNDNLDIDNDSTYAKLIIDSLKGLLIEDDNKKYVRRIELNCHDEDCILVAIERMK